MVRQGQPSPVGRGRGVGGEDEAEGVEEGSGMEEREREGGRTWRWVGGHSFPGVLGVGGGRGGTPPATHAGLSYTTRQCTHSSRHMLGAPRLPATPTPPVFQCTGLEPSLASECGVASPRPQPPVLMEGDRRKNTV